MWALIAKAAISYLEAHPEQVAELIGEGVAALTNHLKATNAAKATAKALPATQ